MTSLKTRVEPKSAAAGAVLESAWRSAVACHRAGHLPQAEELYVAILNVVPAHADANFNLGLIRAQTQRYAQSLANFAAAIETDPTMGEYWLAYVDALVLSGDKEQARDILSKARMHGLQGKRVDELAAQLGLA
jgi:protein O-GlcNAc transferase